MYDNRYNEKNKIKESLGFDLNTNFNTVSSDDLNTSKESLESSSTKESHYFFK